MDQLERLLAANAALRKQVFECQTKATPPTFPLSSHLVIPFQVTLSQNTHSTLILIAIFYSDS